MTRKKLLWLILRLSVAALGVAYVVYVVNWRDATVKGQFQPGVLTMLRHSQWPLLLVGLLLTGIIYPIQTLRWWLLMPARGLVVPMRTTFRLEMVGAFFNTCMPGATGGDLVKIYYASKRKEGRADAMISVLMDRAVGLLALVLVAGVAGLLMWHNDLARRIVTYIWLSLGLAAIGATVYFSQTLRRALGLQWVLDHLPAGRLVVAVDQAVVAYRHHLATVAQTVGLSLIVQIALPTGAILSGYALGLRTPVGLLFTVVPIFLLVSTIPITPQGVGVVEGVAIALIGAHNNATPNQIVGMLLLVRLYQVFFALWGSLFLLGGEIHLHPVQDTEPAEVAAG